MRTYDEWKTTEPHDPWAEEQEIAERELEQEMAEHPERFADGQVCDDCANGYHDRPHTVPCACPCAGGASK